MSRIVNGVIALAIFVLSLTSVAPGPANLKSTLKIVNSTNIRELKHNFAAEDKTGAVAYVYPVGSEESAQSVWPIQPPIPNPEAKQTASPKKLSSQIKDHSVDPTVKVDKKDVVKSTNGSILEKSKEQEVVSTTDSKSNSNHTTSQTSTTSSQSHSNTQGNQTEAHDNEKLECFTRVQSSDEQNPSLIVYNATVQEVEAMGHEVFDTVCKGEDGWDKISAGALASLCCGSG